MRVTRTDNNNNNNNNKIAPNNLTDVFYLSWFNCDSVAYTTIESHIAAVYYNVVRIELFPQVTIVALRLEGNAELTLHKVANG